MPTTVEHAMHEYAHACEDSMCNTVDRWYDATVCPDDSALCQADLNADGYVGVDDLLWLLSLYGSSVATQADLNGDGIVGVDDLLGMLAFYGSSC